MVEIDFLKVRPHGGDRRHGFEELCCQLAALEPAAPFSTLYRKGSGGDAGVECYRVDEDGFEEGWQAKFFDKFGKPQTDQLDGSIKQALKLHGKLKRYVVCLPIDLSDARVGKGLTQLARWQAWVAKWEGRRPGRDAPLQIELWGASQLTERLTREDGHHAGRRLFWFNETTLTPAFLRACLDRSVADLGPRYSPQTAVSLPIRQELLAFARAPLISERARELLNKLDEARHNLAKSLNTITREIGLAPPVDILTLTDSMVSQLEHIGHAGPADHLPWPAIFEKAIETFRLSQSLFAWIRNHRPGTADERPIESRRAAQSFLFRFSDILEEIQTTAGGRAMRLTNETSVVLYGEAGSGKSHLLADVVAHQVETSKPALLLLGNRFSQDDPWTWLQQRLGLNHIARDTMLGALDAAAEAAGCRGLILVDAINERPGLTHWRDTVAGFLETVHSYSHLGILVSCRTTYLPSFEAVLANVPRIKHVGFAGTDGRAAGAYLAKRGIVRPGAPYFSPEFNNPLFLKSCCDLLDRQRVRTMPRGLRGVSAVFDFYLEAVTTSISVRLDLAPRAKIPAAALQRLTEAFVASGENRISYDEAHALTEAVRPSQGKEDEDLLFQFESEGVVSVEPSDDGAEDHVRFTFERLADHLSAQRLLDQHLTIDNPSESFAPGTPLGNLVTSDDAHLRAGLMEALAVQLPERAKAELPDLVEILTPYCPAWNAFAASLAWRGQDAFRERTIELIGEYDRVHSTNLDLRTKIIVATEPENLFNAKDLDRRLRKQPLPKRDSMWSVGIARLAQEGAFNCPARLLIDWAKEAANNYIERDRAYLAAMTLSWIFSTSHRELRDRATKALSALLGPRLLIATELVKSFCTVDDPYVVERVLCAAYGAAMLAQNPIGLAELAEAALDLLKSSYCPVHLLSRDYARGIVALAHFHGCLPSSLNAGDAAPPYRSSWPIEVITKGDIESFKETFPSGTFRDAIVDSTGEFGDFGRYIIQYRTLSFAAASSGPLGRPLTQAELLTAWLADFQSTATAAQMTALGNLLEAVSGWTDNGLAEKAARERSHEFEATLSAPQVHDYANRARSVLLDLRLLTSRQSSEMVSFNLGWASRWICWRAHDLGWRPRLFSDFDRNDTTHSGRMDHRIERVGKKYQWIALHELLARLADHVAFREDRWDEKVDRYNGPWQIGARDIDPSLMLVATHAESNGPECWWAAARPPMPSLPPADRMAWIDYDGDLLNRADLVEVTDLSGRGWLVLDAFAKYSQEVRHDGRRQTEQEAWYRIDCLVCRKRDHQRLLRALAGRSMTDPHAIPDYGTFYRQFLGEHPWHPAWSGLADWMRFKDPHGGRPISIRRPSLEYLAERGGYDYSFDDTMRLELPAPWLLRGLNARLVNGEYPTYVDNESQTMFWDPSIATKGPSAALVDRKAFLSLLDRERLAAVWIVAGEKNAYGSSNRGMGFRFGGSRLHTGVYSFDRKGLTGPLHFERRYPNPEQEAEFLGESGP